MENKTIKSINHFNRRRLVAFIDKDENGKPLASMTDQDATIDTDINVIVARYRKTGVMPEIPLDAARRYFDTTQVVSFQDAQNRIANAKSMFEQLPAELREVMGNNPLNAEAFLKDSKNHEILKKHGFLVEDKPESSKTNPEVKQTPQNTPPATSPTPENTPKAN